jgi:hypothetical protein
MTLQTRVACLTVALTLAAATPAEAQVSSISVTIARGPHAGKYEFTRGQCDGLYGQIISIFTAEMAGLVAGPKTPESIELYTEPGRGKTTDGLIVEVSFRTPSRKRVDYEIYAVPPELQAPGLTKPAKGKGAVTIEVKPEGTRASFKGETQEGIGMEGSINCPRKK